MTSASVVGGHERSGPTTAERAPACATGNDVIELGRRLCGALSARPLDDRLCQALVLAFPARFRAGAALIAQVRDDGNLHIAGQFGYSPRKSFPEVVPLSGDWPIVEALRSPEPLVLVSAAEVIARFPDLDRPERRPRALVATPLLFQGTPVGVAVVGFEHEIPDSVTAALLAGVVRDLVGLYVGLQWSEPEAMTSSYAGRAGRRADDDELTPRQLTILHLLADGLSKGEIAFRIGYSESTVRQETLALYRALGVGDRHACVAAARARGILANSDDVPA